MGPDSFCPSVTATIDTMLNGDFEGRGQEHFNVTCNQHLLFFQTYHTVVEADNPMLGNQ